jgi:hypothetical protein
MFLSGDPELAERRAASGTRIGMAARIFLPANLWLGQPPEAREAGISGSDPMYSSAQLVCAQLVLDAIHGTARQLRFVDVNRAGTAQPLVDRFVTNNDVFPILVRADGARLVGDEAFTKARVRSFVAGA